GQLDRVLPVLRRSLKTKDPPLRQEALVALAAVGRDARPALTDVAAVLFDDSTLHPAGETDPAHLQAVAVLAQFGGAALPTLREAVQYKVPTVRAAALQGLSHLGPRARPALADVQRAVQDRDATVRGEAVRVLAVLGPEAVPALPQLRAAVGDPEAT